MNRLVRVIILVYSTLLALVAAILLYGFLDRTFLALLFHKVTEVLEKSSLGTYKWSLMGVLLFVLLAAAASITYVILSGRLSKTRIRQTDIGIIDIGVDAIENIALNSAKSAQVGIKSAKSHVSSGKKQGISVRLTVVLYSNVEVQPMMNKVQERVKKDIERFTGISVETVSVKVSRVEPIVAKVER